MPQRNIYHQIFTGNARHPTYNFNVEYRAAAIVKLVLKQNNVRVETDLMSDFQTVHVNALITGLHLTTNTTRSTAFMPQTQLKVKGCVYSSSTHEPTSEIRSITCHHTGQYSIYLPRRAGRLS